MIDRCSSLFLTALVVTLTPFLSLAETVNWPRYGGANGDYTTTETVSDAPKEVWRKEIGIGVSAPSIVDGRMYILGSDGSTQNILYCFDIKDGREIWTARFDSPVRERNFGLQYPGGPTSTPTVDAGKVYIMSRFGLVICYDAKDGSEVWRFDVAKEFGQHGAPRWGYSGSPWIVGDKVYLDIGVPGASAVALNKIDGSIIWKAGDQKAGFATPVFGKLDGKDTVLIFAESELVGRDAATGEQLWSFSWPTQYGVNAATPIIIDEHRVFVTTGYGQGAGLYEIRDGKASELWASRDMKSQVAPPVRIGDHIYGFSDGRLVSLDIKTGQSSWDERGIGAGALIAAGEKLIVISKNGDLLQVKPDPTSYQVISSQKIFEAGRGLQSWTTPVVSHGMLFLRNTAGTLVALDAK